MPENSLMVKYILLLLVLPVLFSVFYFSWLPDPDIGSMTIFPPWLGNWTNHFGNLRTAVPFFLLGAILESGLTTIKSFNQKRWLIILGLTTIVSLAEIGQLFLAHRHFDWMDIFWGIAGSVAGMGLALTCRWLLS